jgi:MFS family permease
MLHQTVRAVWPLFFGLGVIGLCIGAQGSLLGIRAELEGFDTIATGLLMSGYYLGFLLGSLRAPAIIQRVGHVRAFGALTALASMTILVHSVIVDPWTWGVMRLLTGFAVSAIYVVAESWLNQAADNRTRGQLLSLYMITMLAGLSGGQFLLNISDPSSFELFTLISILISLAAIPILVTATPMPTFAAARPVGIITLYRVAPTGLVGSFLINACYAMTLGMGAVYASRLGMRVSEISLFIAVLLIGGMLLQWPLGKLSDHMDRRTVIAGSAFAALIFAVASALVGTSGGIAYLLLALLFGGSCFPLLALYLALTNDQLEADQAVGASSTLLLAGGVGASVGPFGISLVMDQWGPSSFFWSLAIMAGLMAGHALYKRISDPFTTSTEPTSFQMQAPFPVGSVLMDPAPEEAQQAEPAHPPLAEQPSS